MLTEIIKNNLTIIPNKVAELSNYSEIVSNYENKSKLIHTVDEFQYKLNEIFESNFEKTKVSDFIVEFKDALIERDDDLLEILENSKNETTLNEWKQPIYKGNNVSGNFNTLKKAIQTLSVVEFMYFNADGMEQVQNKYRKRTVEIFEICQNRKGNLIMSGFLVNNYTKRNNKPEWRYYLLENMKNIRLISRKYRVVRDLWNNGKVEDFKVLVSIGTYFAPSKRKMRNVKFEPQKQGKSLFKTDDDIDDNDV